MGRPPRHDTDGLLDAAVALVATDGPRALTMSAVARAAGAPSGSLYHRFPNQTALLSAVWLRTVTRFQHSFLEALTGGDGAAAARHVVEWCRAHPDQAQVLLAGPRQFAEADWSAGTRETARQQDRILAQALREIAAQSGKPLSRVTLAVVDLPYAVVRRHLARGTDIPATAARDVADAATALLTPLPH